MTSTTRRILYSPSTTVRNFFLFLALLSQFVCLETSSSSRLPPSPSGSNNSTVRRCFEFERKALLEFKQGLNDTSGMLSSWVGKDCCRWNGINCNKRTGNVLTINLGSYSITQGGLRGEISPSLLDLKYLSHLDLSMNDFQGIPIPKFIGSLQRLTYLDLSHASFGGMIPPHLGNLSHLQYLDLSDFPFSLWAADLNWLGGLSSLRYLSLQGANLSQATGWLQAVNMLPSLSELRLSLCYLYNFPKSIQKLNLTSLLVLDLPANNFDISSPPWLFNFTAAGDLQSLDLSHNVLSGDISELFDGLSACCNNSLEYLNLGVNKFHGFLPDSLGIFNRLKSLLLNDDTISGPIPESIGKLSFSLNALDLSYNMMNGSIPASIGKLTGLTSLHLYYNSWNGVLSQTSLQDLTNLSYFSLSSSDKTFIFDVKHDWVPPFSLFDIEVWDCKLADPAFPAWLSTQKQLKTIILSNVSISDTIPDWLWQLSSQIGVLDLSHNQILGQFPTHWDSSQPNFSQITRLDLSHNQISGEIPSNIGHVMSQVSILNLYGNSLNGSIPPSICELKSLISLDLSNNHLSGKIPNHWEGLQHIIFLDLSENNLSGEVPDSLCSLEFIVFLKLSRNNFSGELSWLQNCTGLHALDLGYNNFSGELSWLQNCKSLHALDLGYNGFSGKIPKLIGGLWSLTMIRMRANLFSGNIPEQICLLSNLHLLDLGHNNLTGSIPSCLGNLSGFSSLTSYTPISPAYKDTAPLEQMNLFMKGIEFTYTQTLELVCLLDFSSNHLLGEIPEGITNLLRLGTLNLSRNQLTGNIPEKIGELRLLETLDLSNNRLSGKIPSSMSSMTSLSHLNLSYNHLSGPIPTANQFSTFNDTSIYEGNPELCGIPLSTKCSSTLDDSHEQAKDNKEEEDENDDMSDRFWFYLSLAFGFILGFWGVCGSLAIKRSWRDAYF